MPQLLAISNRDLDSLSQEDLQLKELAQPLQTLRLEEMASSSLTPSTISHVALMVLMVLMALLLSTVRCLLPQTKAQ